MGRKERRAMKKFTIEVSHASPGQLTTIGLELKIMSNAWAKFGPRIKINGQQVQAPSVKLQAASDMKQTQLKSRIKRRKENYGNR